MNVEKLTNKSREAIEKARSVAGEYSASAIGDVHLLIALLSDSEGLIPSLLKKMETNVPELLEGSREIAASMPKVSGAGYSNENVYVTRECDKVLSGSEKIMSDMGDEYISVEHIFLSMTDNASDKVKDLLKKHKITKKRSSFRAEENTR